MTIKTDSSLVSRKWMYAPLSLIKKAGFLGMVEMLDEHVHPIRHHTPSDTTVIATGVSHRHDGVPTRTHNSILEYLAPNTSSRTCSSLSSRFVLFFSLSLILLVCSMRLSILYNYQPSYVMMRLHSNGQLSTRSSKTSISRGSRVKFWPPAMVSIWP